MGAVTSGSRTSTRSATRSTVTRAARAPKLDQACADASGVARSGVEGVDPEFVGEHLDVQAEGERVVTHFFECRQPGYRGWRWAVTVARVSRSRHVTVCETALLPGPDALAAPPWVPWQDRLQPGDLGVGDILPTAPDDDRLAPGYVLSDDPAVEEVTWELGLGRARVLSREGRADAAERWYEGDSGPQSPISTAAPASARCGGCGFYLPLAGALRLLFGACANAYAPDDGQVVSIDHGCGAHSEILVEPVAVVTELATVYDDSEVDQVTTPKSPGSVPEDADEAESYGHG
jgi:hypothetical protein